jgi:hypothetical protein
VDVQIADPTFFRTTEAAKQGFLIATIAPSGEVISNSRIATDRSLNASGITTDAQNGVYVLGDYFKIGLDDDHDPLDLDPGEQRFLLRGPDGGIFVLKLESGGGFITAFLI